MVPIRCLFETNIVCVSIQQILCVIKWSRIVAVITQQERRLLSVLINPHNHFNILLSVFFKKKSSVDLVV